MVTYKDADGGSSQGNRHGDYVIKDEKYYHWMGTPINSYIQVPWNQLDGMDKDMFVPYETTPLEGSDVSIGEQDFGIETFTQEQYQGMTPDAFADYIFKTKYGEKIPGGSSDKFPTEEHFKEEIKRLASLAAPQIGEIDQTKAGFLAEQYGGGDVSFKDSFIGRQAIKQKESDIYGLQSEAYKFSPAISTGTGGGMRANIMGQKGIKKEFESATDTYGLTKDIAEFDYSKGIYELEQEQKSTWESQFKQFVGSLPQAGGT